MQDQILDIINRFQKQSASEEEKRQLSEWLEESEENRRFYSLFAANYSLHEAVTAPSLNKDMEAMMARLDARISDSERPRRFGPARVAGFAFAFAAALAVLFFVFRGGVPGSSPVQQIPMELAVNNNPSTIHLLLGDGTSVYLASGARLSHNVTSLKNSREVELQGEAYFDVARDESRPFVVKTPNIGVKVLGTAFSVSASPERSEVVLERGSVRLLSPEGNAMVTLSPNQKASYLSLTGDMSVEPVYATAFVTEKYNLVNMSDVSLDEMLAKLSELYGVRICSSGSVDNKHYNLAFLKSDSLQDVVSIVEYLTGAQLEILNHN
ncbi:MAG: FecR family protein [Bacteroidales bacterium]|nr:FecR family protein [Bacteroidales bacterium]